MSDLLISVVIPAYNREKTIKYCIDSVLAQSYKNFEVIVVDDCSVDGTVDIVNSYNDNRIKLFKLNQNSGAQHCRNVGIKNSLGSWIAFLDSDDEWLPDKLEKQIDVLAKHNYDPYLVIHSDAILVDKLNDETRLFNIAYTNGSDVYKLMLTRPAPMFQAMLVSKLALESIGYLDEEVPSYQEWDTAIRLSKICSFFQLENPTFKYYYHEGDTISKDYKRDIIGYDFIINKFNKDIMATCGKKVWFNHLYVQYSKCMNWYLYDYALAYVNMMPFSLKKFSLKRKVLRKINGLVGKNSS